MSDDLTHWRCACCQRMTPLADLVSWIGRYVCRQCLRAGTEREPESNGYEVKLGEVRAERDTLALRTHEAEARVRELEGKR